MTFKRRFFSDPGFMNLMIQNKIVRAQLIRDPDKGYKLALTSTHSTEVLDRLAVEK